MEHIKFTDEYRNEVCKIGQGHDCCRFLTMGRDFECAKHTSLRTLLDNRVAERSMTARGDNCEGVFKPLPAYRLLKDRFEHKAGSVIYKASGYDYGLASDDAEATGKPHTSMTLEASGGYPFFTVADEDFEPLQT
jgi:hypothetical protein